ncbi:4-hydroxyphenylpyruvate dioxygenase [Pontibacter sp. G13]|uniref:4-hydroxyphenylpyruvate dioxygenase n=1 Tax=Pontibacter sp. G13 TaxID=3074898 RepID=UPI00288BFFC2|nr:4-hydroxyphenylpyruvate dioxygenase [Pontibacter sp. G13]WNJ16772.1 4-hydroxyphenylpyruvate dioxygenase [Pontibacter sp. G13]
MQDFLPLQGIDHIEFYVGNAKQAAHYYKTAFGFQSFAYAGPETGVRDRASYVLKQDKITLILTTPLRPTSEIAAHIHMHGDGVKVVAFTVKDARKSYEETIKRGAESHMEPTVISDDHGEIVMAGIKTYGETVHLFIEREAYNGVFAPGYQKWESAYNPTTTGIRYVDHMVGNVGWYQMNKWCKFYEEVLGFTQMISFDDKDISTEYTALMSKVMSNGTGKVKFPINEPAFGKKKSQIEEYLDFYQGEGVQHIAVGTGNIIETVKEMISRGVEFLHVPTNYYDELPSRVGEIDEEISELKELGILVDRDDDGYLLQIFSKPVEDRPTLFFEIIQRKGARSFGKGNFKALFEAIEREQEMRGNL